jgi:hypothetical protein
MSAMLRSANYLCSGDVLLSFSLPLPPRIPVKTQIVRLGCKGVVGVIVLPGGVVLGAWGGGMWVAVCWCPVDGGVNSDFFKDDGGRPRLSWVFSMLFVSLLADPCCRSVRVVGEVLPVADNRNVCCTVGDG